MFAYSTSLVILAFSLCGMSISQVLIKWRFSTLTLALGKDGDRWGFILAAMWDKWIWLAVALLVTSAVAWYGALTRLPLTLMLPLAGIISPAVALMAYGFLNEPLSGAQMGAILLIAVGVAWLGYLQ